MHDDRHRRARRQRRARGNRDGAAHASRSFQRRNRHPHDAPLSDRTHVRQPHRHDHSAQQGDRRRQRVRARIGHPSARHAQASRDVRNHASARTSAARARRSCSANIPAATRCASGWRMLGHELDEAQVDELFTRFKSLCRQEEGSARQRSRSACARPRSGSRRSVAPDASARDHAISAAALRRSCACAHERRPRRQRRAIGDGPVDAVLRALGRAIGHELAIDEFHVRALGQGGDAQGRGIAVDRAYRVANCAAEASPPTSSRRPRRPCSKSSTVSNANAPSRRRRPRARATPSEDTTMSYAAHDLAQRTHPTLAGSDSARAVRTRCTTAPRYSKANASTRRRVVRAISASTITRAACSNRRKPLRHRCRASAKTKSTPRAAS